MNTSELLSAAFHQSSFKQREIYENWLKLSFSLGGLLPNSLLVSSIQRLGKLDLLLRSLESEFAPELQDKDLTLLDNQFFLSEIWVGQAYAITSTLIRRNPQNNQKLKELNDFLRILRVVIEKHEVADEKVLGDWTLFNRLSGYELKDIYIYDKAKSDRAYIMPAGVSGRGSVTWQVYNAKSEQSYWCERLYASELFLEFVQKIKTT